MRTIKLIGLIVAILSLLTAIIVLITEGIKLWRELPAHSSTAISTSQTFISSFQSQIPTDTIDTQAQSPRMFNFQSCIEECNGINSTSTFPEKITRINLKWQYKNIPPNASYVRFQTFEGMEWIRYVCIWPHSSSGTESVYFTEPAGLRSGDWIFTVMINEETLLQQTLHIQGNWNYWDPVGTLYVCYGTTD